MMAPAEMVVSREVRNEVAGWQGGVGVLKWTNLISLILKFVGFIKNTRAAGFTGHGYY